MIPWGPLIAALIVLGQTRGWTGIKLLFSDMFRYRVGIRWYALAFLLPIGVTFGAVYVNVAMGAPAPDTSIFATSELIALIPQLILTTFLAGPFTEEPAWRGFLLPRLQTRVSPWIASLIIGLIWWSWHLPLMVSDPTGQRPPLAFLGMTLSLSFLFTWIYNNANSSLFPIALLHGVTNTFAAFLFPSQFGESYLRLWWIYNLLWATSAAAVIAWAGTRANKNEELITESDQGLEAQNF